MTENGICRHLEANEEIYLRVRLIQAKLSKIWLSKNIVSKKEISLECQL
jgi:hypothetical protein